MPYSTHNYLLIDKDDTLGSFRWNNEFYPNVKSFLEQQVHKERTLAIVTSASIEGAKLHLSSS